MEPRSGQIKVYPIASGKYESIYVKEGDAVNAGDLLAMVNTSPNDSIGGEVAQHLLALADQAESEIRATIKIQKQSYEVETTRIRQEIDNAQHLLGLMANEHNLLHDRIESNDRIFLSKQTLFQKHVISEQDFAQAQDQRFALLAQGSAFDIQVQQQREKLQAFEAQLLQLPITQEQALLELNEKLLDVEQQKVEISGGSRTTLVAPSQGVVTAVSAIAGGKASLANPLLSIVPENEDLVAVLYVESTAISSIEKGQEVRVVFDAFPFATYGDYVAHVSFVSQNSVDPRELMLPADIVNSTFVVKADLEQQYVTTDKTIPLQAGLGFSAQIVVSQQTLLELVLSPLNSLRRRL